MMKHQLYYLLTLLAVFSTVYADELKHDPFSRPLLVAPGSVTAVTSSITATADAKSGNTNIAVEDAWSPKLVAIMVAGKKSLVNVEGRLIRIGEDIEGYRLVKVHDSEAIFYKDHKRIVLRIDEKTLKEAREGRARGGL